MAKERKTAQGCPKSSADTSASLREGLRVKVQSRGAGIEEEGRRPSWTPGSRPPTFPFPFATRALTHRPQIPPSPSSPRPLAFGTSKRPACKVTAFPPVKLEGGLSPHTNPSPRAPAPHAPQNGHLRPATRFSSRSPRLCGHQSVPGSRYPPRMGLDEARDQRPSAGSDPPAAPDLWGRGRGSTRAATARGAAGAGRGRAWAGRRRTAETRRRAGRRRAFWPRRGAEPSGRRGAAGGASRGRAGAEPEPSGVGPEGGGRAESSHGAAKGRGARRCGRPGRRVAGPGRSAGGGGGGSRAAAPAPPALQAPRPAPGPLAMVTHAAAARRRQDHG